MLEASNAKEEEHSNVIKLRNLRQHAQAQAQQIAKIQAIVNQLAEQLIITSNKQPTTIRKPKIALLEKYRGDRDKLRVFLTNINLYYKYNKVPNNQKKILIASIYIKNKASNQIQLYVDNYLLNTEYRETKVEIQALFASQIEFKEEIEYIFREVDAKNQAKKKITRLRQTTLVSAYIAKFKQL